MQNCLNEPKNFLKLLDTLKNGSSQNIDYVSCIEPQRWINMFKSLLYNSEVEEIDERLDYQGHVDDIMTCEITLDELQKATKKLKTGKTSGLDQILNEMIICSIGGYPGTFLKLFNNLLNNGIFPSCWTQSMIIPLHKKRG